MTWQTMYKGLVNSPETTITNNISESDTIIYVLDPARVPELPNLMTLGTGTNAETVKVTEISGSAITVERGFQGIAKSWPAGTVIARNFTEYDHAAFKANIEELADGLNDLAGEDRTDETVKGNADALAAHLADITAHNRTLTHLTYYVNADIGNDNNQGTFEAPFKTIKKAIDSIPVGTVGWVRLLGGTAFSIDTSIYVYNKVVVLEGMSDETLVNITSTIHLIDSTFSINRINMYAETPAIFYCSGIVGIKCGGYNGLNVRPLQETSNVNFIYVSAAAMGDYFFTRPVAIYLIGDRLHFRTDNYPSYSGTFNVFAKDPYYTFPVVFTRWRDVTKDVNVNWGATEYQLGSSGTSLWYFEGV